MIGYVYILKSSDGRYYVGSTTNVANRVKQHESGHTHSTMRFDNPELVFHQKFGSIQEARAIETKIKKWKRKDFLDKIIEDQVIKISARSSAG